MPIGSPDRAWKLIVWSKILAMLRFTWDVAKAVENLRKHEIDFREATTAFSDPHSISIPDPDHSRPGEERWLLLGFTQSGQLVVVAHADQRDEIRLITARLATRPERETYEEEDR
jgi:uncharacterized DUF497 family protein